MREESRRDGVCTLRKRTPLLPFPCCPYCRFHDFLVLFMR
jgi:hypothetical protein